MTAPVRQLLNSFESLSDAEKHEATLEILRRTSASGDVPECTLVEAAEELFQKLDEEDAGHAPR